MTTHPHADSVLLHTTAGSAAYARPIVQTVTDAAGFPSPQFGPGSGDRASPSCRWLDVAEGARPRAQPRGVYAKRMVILSVRSVRLMLRPGRPRSDNLERHRSGGRRPANFRHRWPGVGVRPSTAHRNSAYTLRGRGRQRPAAFGSTVTESRSLEGG
jgi:hypothetical protein